MSVQLKLDGSVATPEERPRAGCIGKVQRLINEQPWMTAGEIADAVAEPSSRVSEALNKLKHEGRAQFVEKLGAHDRHVWAGTSEDGRELREEAMRAVKRSASERSLEKLAKAAGAEVEEIDWRPQETVPEDFYAL